MCFSLRDREGQGWPVRERQKDRQTDSERDRQATLTSAMVASLLSCSPDRWATVERKQAPLREKRETSPAVNEQTSALQSELKPAKLAASELDNWRYLGSCYFL